MRCVFIEDTSNPDVVRCILVEAERKDQAHTRKPSWPATADDVVITLRRNEVELNGAVRVMVEPLRYKIEDEDTYNESAIEGLARIKAKLDAGEDASSVAAGIRDRKNQAMALLKRACTALHTHTGQNAPTLLNEEIVAFLEQNP